jgi:hypothetical protein
MMVKNERTSGEEYRAVQPEAAQRVLQPVQRIIRRTLQAEEVVPEPATLIRDIKESWAREVREHQGRNR